MLDFAKTSQAVAENSTIFAVFKMAAVVIFDFQEIEILMVFSL